MEETCSIFAGSTGLWEREEAEGSELLMPFGLFMYQRMARKPTRATATICGILMLCSAIVLVGGGERAWPDLGGTVGPFGV